jgi:hypothetical protein
LGILNGAMVFVTICFGLLGATATWLLMNVTESLPGTTNLDSWQATPMLTGLAVIALIGVFGFITSQAGRRVFDDSLMIE